MYSEIIYLKDMYDFLKRDADDPTVTVIAQTERSDIKRPALIICPGGAYYHLAVHEGEPVALEFLADGVQCFILKYSCYPHSYPQQLLEVACTVDYIVKNAEKFSVDINKIAIAGFSAGGHLAASYCTLLKSEEIAKFIDARPVNAAILGYPVITAYGKTSAGTFMHLTGHKKLEEVTSEEKEQFSLEKHVSNITPPTFLFHTSDDGGVNVNNSLVYMKALNDYNIPFEAHIFPHGKHGISTGTKNALPQDRNFDIDYASKWIVLARRWLKTTLDF